MACARISRIAERTVSGIAEIKLKTCPFCGGEAAVVKWRKAMAYLPVIDSYQVVCAYCDCRTARHPSKEKAVDVWNRREDGEKHES